MSGAELGDGRVFRDARELDFGDEVVFVFDREEAFVEHGQAEEFSVEFGGKLIEQRDNNKPELLMLPVFNFLFAHGFQVIHKVGVVIF